LSCQQAQRAASGDQCARQHDVAAERADQAAIDQLVAAGKGDQTAARDQAAARRDERAELDDQLAVSRDQLATRRDQAADVRDQAAEARDRAAELRGQMASRRPRPDDPALLAGWEQAVIDQEIASSERQLAAADRQAAALDRQEAWAERREAALERARAVNDRSLAAKPLARWGGAWASASAGLEDLGVVDAQQRQHQHQHQHPNVMASCWASHRTIARAWASGWPLCHADPSRARVMVLFRYRRPGACPASSRPHSLRCSDGVSASPDGLLLPGDTRPGGHSDPACLPG
jgi:hypothetical protein